MLCKYCAARYGIESYGKECCICQGKMEKFYSLLESIKKPIVANADYFGISTSISKKILIKEEEFLAKAKKSIKSEINESLKARIGKMLKHDQNNATVMYKLNFTTMELKQERGDVFLFGRYYKLAQPIAQKIWKRKRFESVEEIIGEQLKAVFNAKAYCLHASGREDVDALCIAGRPFVIELNRVGRIVDVSKKIVGKDYAFAYIYGRVKRSFVEAVANSHFDKCYRAYYNVQLSEEEAKALEEKFRNIEIRQFTPKRVERRRAKRLRKRFVYGIKVDRQRQFIDIHCEAGLYVKELFTGDEGRTKPSFSEFLGKSIECVQLIVTEIYDRFLDVIWKNHII